MKHGFLRDWALAPGREKRWKPSATTCTRIWYGITGAIDEGRPSALPLLSVKGALREKLIDYYGGADTASPASDPAKPQGEYEQKTWGPRLVASPLGEVRAGMFHERFISKARRRWIIRIVTYPHSGITGPF